MKKALPLLFLLLASCSWAQNLKLSFMSESGARFFLYLDGKLQNTSSVGNITLQHLENKPYQVRIEIDDPYQMVCIKQLRPSEQNYEYTVFFNAVRERIYIKPLKKEKPQKRKSRK